MTHYDTFLLVPCKSVAFEVKGWENSENLPYTVTQLI
jgi:hypothetical protein